jgi:hypothetical protein
VRHLTLLALCPIPQILRDDPQWLVVLHDPLIAAPGAAHAFLSRDSSPN